MSEGSIKRKLGLKQRVKATERQSSDEEKKGPRQIVLYKKDEDESAEYQWGVVEAEEETEKGSCLKLTNGISINKKDVKKTLSINFQKAIAGYIEGEKEFRPSRFLSTHTVKLVSYIYV